MCHVCPKDVVVTVAAVAAVVNRSTITSSSHSHIDHIRTFLRQNGRESMPGIGLNRACDVWDTQPSNLLQPVAIVVLGGSANQGQL